MFVDVRIAIGDLVLAGIDVQAFKVKRNGGIDLFLVDSNKLGGLLIASDNPIADNKNACICRAYRDGTTWKVKADTIDDYIELNGTDSIYEVEA